MPVTFGNEKKFEMPGILTVAGSDKLSINTFSALLKRLLGETYEVGVMHSFMSKEASNLFLEDFSRENVKAIITYFARRKVNLPDPLIILPVRLQELSDHIYWFDLYTSEPKILKQKDPAFTRWLMEEWKKITKT
jgi:hypothetical protein